MRQKLSQRQVIAKKIVYVKKKSNAKKGDAADINICLNCTAASCNGDCEDARAARKKELKKKEQNKNGSKQFTNTSKHKK